MIYVIYPDVDIWNYVLKDVENKTDAIVRPLNRYCHKWQIVLRKVFRNHYIPSWLLFNSRMRKELRGLKENDSLLVCDYTPLCLFMSLSSIVNKKVKKKLWIWNPIKDNKEYYEVIFSKIKKLGFSAATFDPSDAECFGIDFYSQFFRMEYEKDQKQETLYDFYFIGFSKGRDKIIKSLDEVLTQRYTTLFKIVNDVSECIPYSENVKNLKHSRCLVDIVQPNQMGLTLRPLEALSFQKKLISNNKKLINYDFYHKDNIFILGVDNLEDIDAFMKTPYHQIENNIIKQYDVTTWLNSFIVFDI